MRRNLILPGGTLYRFNVYLIGFNPGRGWHYFPSFAEIMISVGIVSIELLGYQVLSKLLPVLPNPHMQRNIAPANPHRLSDTTRPGIKLSVTREDT